MEKKMSNIETLRDLTELSKHNITNTLFEAMNAGTVTLEREDAAVLVRLLSTTMDESFQTVAAKESRPAPKAKKKSTRK